MLITPNRLATVGEYDEFVLAGKNAAQDTLVIAIAPPRPAGDQAHTIELNLHNLPFPTGYHVTVFGLSESSFEQGDYFPVVEEFTADTTELSLTLNYTADQNSGRLYTIVLAALETTAVTAAPARDEAIDLFPNPTTDRVTVRALRPHVSIESLLLYNAVGQRIVRYRPIDLNRSDIDLTGLAAGLYLVRVVTNTGEVWTRLLKQ